MADEPDLFAQVVTVGTVGVIMAQIQEIIIERHLLPGDKLPPERDLALTMSVGRNVLREAIGRLCQKGLLVTRSGRGTFVAEPSLEGLKESLELLLRMNQINLIELCDVRLLIEPKQASLAAKNANKLNTAPLMSAFKMLRTAAHDANEHVLADLAFHNAIADLAHHSLFKAIVAVVQEPVTRGMVVGTKVPRAIDASDEQHEKILKAILAGHATKAEAAMREHIGFVREYLSLHGGIRTQLNDRSS
ncbi:MAG: FadR/GntR family transcriptional regulator [Actinomycetes bacterium]|jgi:GntR family transcriptional regulator, transcriptional repressor for pyruvate dehydrogenase complex